MGRRRLVPSAGATHPSPRVSRCHGTPSQPQHLPRKARQFSDWLASACWGGECWSSHWPREHQQSSGCGRVGGDPTCSSSASAAPPRLPPPPDTQLAPPTPQHGTGGRIFPTPVHAARNVSVKHNDQLPCDLHASATLLLIVKAQTPFRLGPRHFNLHIAAVAASHSNAFFLIPHHAAVCA